MEGLGFRPSHRLLGSVYLLVFGRAQVAERRMGPLAVEEDLNVIEDGGRELAIGSANADGQVVRPAKY